MTDNVVPVLWIDGAECTGKSVVAWEVFARIWHGGPVKPGYIDFAQIAFAAPRPPDDPTGRRLRQANVMAMWKTFYAAGARCLVLSGAADDRVGEAPGNDGTPPAVPFDLPGMAVTRCRLRASADVLRDRVFRRGRGDGGGPQLPGDTLLGLPDEALEVRARRAVREAARLDATDTTALVVENDALSPAEVAARIIAATNWPAGGGTHE
ncbi:hypothetical protein [Streptomyces sp. RFCAC02]|uniref:hypothetical protein n=1 Tax=Streptomyces sp. RFCAC02 TaxID=2499143 RepID=UPI00101F6497|nr:hypothetical protein [Streptomyces sp. RFCAC02]